MPTQTSTSNNLVTENLDITLESGASAQVHANRELTIDEDVLVYRSQDSGTNYTKLVGEQPSRGVLLHKTKSDGTIYGPGWFRVVKPASSDGDNLQLFADT